MRPPQSSRSERELSQLARQIQDDAQITGVNASGTQISSKPFEMVTEFEPSGDQPQAIAKLVDGIERGMHGQLLLGVTGSGKTYTMAKVISQCQRPTIIMAHNKTLAAQLYGEFKAFFPHNAVEYFVSYYDYYQPEAYVPASDTFIEKDSAINDHIDQMRLSATRALLERRDAIIIASVSCIYGLGDPDNFITPQFSCAAVKSGTNFARYCDKTLDGLISQGKTLTEQDKRSALYQKAQAQIQQQALWLPLAHPTAYALTRKDVQGYQVSPFGRQDFSTVSVKP